MAKGPPTTSPDRRERDRERKRRQREREEAGIQIYRLEIGSHIEDALAERGLLHPSVADEPEAVARALKRLIFRSLGLDP
jgi:hypothetical protein